jgi:hypothetical protein
VIALDTSGATVVAAATGATQHVPQLLVLAGAKPIAKVRVLAPADETALLEFCVL